MFLSGPYIWSLGELNHSIADETALLANGLGVVEDAPTFRLSRDGDPITGDNLGANIQAVVDRGGNLFIDMVLQELNVAAVLRAYWPYDPTAANDLTPALLGRMQRFATGPPDPYSGIGRLTPTQELRATKILNSGEVDTTDGRFYHLMRFKRAQLSPGFDITQLLGSRLRNVPMSFLCSLFPEGTYPTSSTHFWTNDAPS